MLFRRSRRAANDDGEAVVSQTTVIGRDSHLEGIISAAGTLRIEGTVRGTVTAKVCVIDEDGLVEGEVSADEIVVRGRVVGPLRAYHVHLQNGAQVDGDVMNETIAIDSGAALNGAVRQSDDPLGAGSPASGARETAEAPDRQGEPAYLRSPLWNGADDDGRRPLRALRLR
ncbi:MAG: polymer-forming cytoskeletal protein [Rhizobiales bacterium]|nr:polymer-forming cytoskeletal protein [Hyphomicrobiales bacterium]MBI3672600.1 polymer-forming cytoskeletal protein [Hyphomicrobiales bacterium]